VTTSVHQNGEPLLVRVSLEAGGSAYALDPLSKSRVRDTFPEAHILPGLFFGYEQEEEFESLHRPLWPKAAQLLTGLTVEQIEQLGGIKFYNPRTKQVVWEWHQLVTTN